MKKLLEAKKEIGKVVKNSQNPHFKKSYADINALLEEVEPILLKHGLLLLQPIIEGKVVTEITDVESGESKESSLTLPQGLNPQQLGSAVTYFRRYTLQSLLSLRATDDDGNDASKTPTPVAPTPVAPVTPAPKILEWEQEIIDQIKDFTKKSDLKYFMGTLSEMQKSEAVRTFANNHNKTLNQ